MIMNYNANYVISKANEYSRVWVKQYCVYSV